MVIVIIGLMFVIMAQPMSLVMLLMMVTLYYSLMIFSYSLTFWFSFIILIIVVSGVLVVFSYMASLSPNEKFEIKWIGVLIFLMLGENEGGGWGEAVSFSSLSLWEGSVMGMNLFVVGFLLYVMVAVVWMSGWKCIGTVKNYYWKK